MAEQQLIDRLLQGKESWNQRVETDRVDLSHLNISQILQDAERLTESGKPDLRGYDLSSANLSESILNGVDLTDAYCILSQFNGACLTNADLSRAKCDFANFTNARLDYATLHQTGLWKADLTGANLEGSRFWTATLFQLVAEQKFQETSENSPALDLVDGVPKLLDQIKVLQKHFTCLDPGETQLYYRGEATDCWPLTPSVMRDPRFLESEQEMLVDLRSRRPEDFAHDNTAIGQMVIAQHYGLPTRLLDVTRNPLVALFHSVDNATPNQKDGRLHIFALPKDMVRPFNSDTVSILANFARLRRGEQNMLLGKTNEDTKGDIDPGDVLGRHVDYEDALAHIYQLIRLEKPSFAERIDPKDFLQVFGVEPQQSFERLRAQSGAFLLSAFHERFEEQNIQEWNNETPRYHHRLLSVPETAKKQIRAELSILNITREGLLPSLDETAKSITDRVRASNRGC